MKLNVGTADRIIRIILGLAGIGIALSGISPWGWVGVVPLATGAVSFCPLYTIVGLNTRKKA